MNEGMIHWLTRLIFWLTKFLQPVRFISGRERREKNLKCKFLFRLETFWAKNCFIKPHYVPVGVLNCVVLYCEKMCCWSYFEKLSSLFFQARAWGSDFCAFMPFCRTTSGNICGSRPSPWQSAEEWEFFSSTPYSSTWSKNTVCSLFVLYCASILFVMQLFLRRIV